MVRPLAAEPQPVAGPSNPSVLQRRRQASRRRPAPPPPPVATAVVHAPRDSTTTIAVPVPTASYLYPATTHSTLSPGLLAVLILCGLAAAAVLAVTLFCCHRVSRRRKGMRPAQGTQRSVLADELRTWASKVNVVHLPRAADVEAKPSTEDEPKVPPRAASPIHPGLLHTPSRPSSFILDISAKSADPDAGDPELDPWADARVFTPASEPANPFGSAYVRSSESVARQAWAVSSPAAAAVPLPRSPIEPAHPALSVRTSSLVRPGGPRSPASPDSSSPHTHTSGTLPDLGYGPGSAFGGRPGSSTHAPSVAGPSPHTSGTYGAYDTHERPDWMPAPLPPATLSPVPEARTPRAADRFSAGSARLSPIMWARPEAYAN